MRTRSSWTLLFVAALAISTSSVFGQTPAAGQAPASSTPAQPAAVFHLTTNLVLVDVVVTDKGKAVHGLDRAKFHLFEDGRERPIAGFDEHQPAAAPPALAVPPQLPPHTYGNTPVYPQTGVFNVLLLDGLNTPQTDQMRTRQQMIEYMGKIQPGTMIAVFTLSSRLRMVTGFTTDVAQLTKAVKDQKIKPDNSILLNGSTAPDALDSLQSHFDVMANPSLAIPGPLNTASAAIQQFEADSEDAATDVRVRMTLDALKQLGLYLSAIPGRKNLIWFSGSFPISLNPQYMQGSRPQAGNGYEDDIRKTNNLLTAARVAVYPVDARGLMTLAAFSPDGRSTGPAMSGPGVVDIAPLNAAFVGTLDVEHSAMRQIADLTGGQAYVNTNGLKEAVASAVENGESYYTLAYTPAAKKLDGAYHKVQVRLDGASYRLAYRRGYYADAPGKSTTTQAPKTLSPFLASAVHGAPPATQVLFEARVLPAGDPQLAGPKVPDSAAGEMTASLKSPPHRYVVDWKIDARTLAFAQTPDGLHQTEFECVLVGYDADGKRLNWEDGAFTVPLDANQYAGILAKGLPLRMALDLPAGHVFLRIAIHDRTADHAGALEVPLAVAAN
jgi:VWFA-related protein